MAGNLTFGGGIEVGGGIKAGPHNIYEGVNTISVQNVAGTDDATGFFFQGGSWPNTPKPSYNDIAAGWTVVQLPGATVVSTNPGAQTITITGGTFLSGVAYTFTGN